MRSSSDSFEMPGYFLVVGGTWGQTSPFRSTPQAQRVFQLTVVVRGDLSGGGTGAVFGSSPQQS